MESHPVSNGENKHMQRLKKQKFTAEKEQDQITHARKESLGNTTRKLSYSSLPVLDNTRDEFLIQ